MAKQKLNKKRYVGTTTSPTEAPPTPFYASQYWTSCMPGPPVSFARRHEIVPEDRTPFNWLHSDSRLKEDRVTTMFNVAQLKKL